MNYEDSTAENNTMVNVGNGVDISSVSSNTHQTPGYDDGPDMLKIGIFVWQETTSVLPELPALVELHGSAVV